MLIATAQEKILAGRHKNASKRPDRGTGKPSDGKDRTAHDQGRGVKMSYVAFINERPTPEFFQDVRSVVETESDRGVAIMFSALVEQELEMALRRRLDHLTKAELDEWFSGSNAPFRTFGAKIKLCRGMQIYDAEVEGILTLIRKIRNAFSHRALPATFESNPLASLKSDLLNELLPIGFTNKETFAAYCLGLVSTMRGVAHDQLDK